MPLDYAEKYDIIGEGSTNIVGGTKNFLLSTGADIVSTLWNSLPFTENVETRDILQKIDEDAATFFDEHPDAVRTASLIGGAFIPGGVAVKLLGRARSGLTALGYTENYLGAAFAGQKQKALVSEIQEVFKNGGAATREYKNVRNRLYVANFAKETIDNAVIEAAVIGGMNAHPFLDDYFEDPLRNFTLSTLLGAGIGFGIGFPATRRLISASTGGLALESLGKVAESYKTVNESFTNAAKFQAYTNNMRRLEQLAKDESQFPITRTTASNLHLAEAAGRDDALRSAVPDWDKLDTEVKQSIIELLGKPEFIGVDKVRIYDLSKGSSKETAKVIEIEGTKGTSLKQLLPMFSDAKDPFPKSFVTPEGKPAIAFVRLSTGEVFAASGAKNAGLAVDIPDIRALLKARLPENANVFTPVKGFTEDNLFRNLSSAEQDARFLKELVEVNKVTPEQLQYNLVTAPDDLPRQNAIVSLFEKLSPEDKAKLNIKVTTDFPTFVQQQAYIRNVVEKTVHPDYRKLAVKYTEDRDLVLGSQNLSQNAKDMLTAWIHGGQFNGKMYNINEGISMVRRAFSSFLHGTALPLAERGNERIAAEIWNAGAKFREKMRTIADSDGYVVLWRGFGSRTKGKITSSAAVESYTSKESVARNFSATGKAHLFKVHVDNIIGTLGSGPMGEAEILVSAPHNQIIDAIPVPGAITSVNKAVEIPNAGSKEVMTEDEFIRFYMNNVENHVKDLLANKNFGIEEIAARTNLTSDVTRFLAYGGNLADWLAQGNNYLPWRRYTDVNKLDEYLSPKNKLYALLGNPRKNPSAEIMANLDAKDAFIMHRETVEQYTMLSTSDIGKRVLEIYQSPEMQLRVDELLQKINQINNQLVGDPRWQSADNAFRQIDLGPTVTALGKRFTDTMDTLVRDHVEPVATSFLALKNNPAALAEFNSIVAKRAELRGWADIVPETVVVDGVEKPTGKYYLGQYSAKIKGEDTVISSLEKAQKLKSAKLEPVRRSDGSIWYVQQPEVLQALDATRPLSGMLLSTHNLIRTITGQAPLNDIGFYLPPIHLVNRSIAFVVDTTGENPVRLLVANGDAELQSLLTTFNQQHASEITAGKINVFTKGEQQNYNKWKNYTDYEAFTTYANAAYEHKGTAGPGIVPSDLRLVENILMGYENVIRQSARKYSEIYLNHVTDWLDNLSGFYQRGVSEQPRRGIFKEIARDSAKQAKNILLGRSQLDETTAFKATNSLFEMLLNNAGNIVNQVGKTFGEKTASKEYFDQLGKDLAKSGLDIKNIWSSFDEYLATTRSDFKNLAPSVISAGHGLLATMMLRVFELAQTSVNIMSLPILTWSALMEKLPGTVINANGEMIKFPMRVMMDGMRFMNSPQGKEIIKEWEKQGFIKQTTRQFTELVGAIKNPTQSKELMDTVINTVNKLQDNKLVKDFLAKPADWAEEFTRTYAMSVGYLGAKTAYPGIDNTGATIAAINFADRAIGNYHANQRPTWFQGSLGAALGLFQTYMLTFAQSIYRGIENQNFKQLAALMLAQTGLFGMKSWPGYNLLSEQLVANFNDDHWDLTTGTYRALNKPAAELVLYGLPSSLGPSFYTRGDISPRVPSTMGELAVFNGLQQGWNAAYQIVKRVGEGLADGTPVQNFFEALSLQSLNRPIARWSELVTGASVTRIGNTVTPTAEVWTPVGIAARLIATRPLEEQVVRDAYHMNQFYEALDRDRRQDVMLKLRTALRDGSLSDNLISEAATDYLRYGGSARGWRAALNEAMIRSEEGTRYDLLRKLEPDSPINRMIEDRY